MAGTLSAGVNSLILKLDTPYDTIRTTDIRDDLVKVKVWCSATPNFTPVDTKDALGVANANPNQVFDGLSLSIVITQLADLTSLVAGTQYYVKYAFISDIEEAVFTVSAQLTATPVAAAAQTIDISGYTSFVQNAALAFTPTNTTITATYQNITGATYSWAISGATPTTATGTSVTITPNNGSTGITVTLTATGGNLTSTLTKTINMPIVYNGAKGEVGAAGTMSAFPSIYQWTSTSTPPARPTTTSIYTWGTGDFTAPSTWSKTIETNTSPGYYLWSITVPIVALGTETQSTLDWTNTTYAIKSISYNGSNGSNGSATYVVVRAANDNSAPTNAEVTALIGRNPVAGDVATVSFNNSNGALIYKYTTSWALMTTYFPGSLIVQGTITGDRLVTGTVTADLIDSRGLSIKDSLGNVILSAGVPLTASNITAPSTWVNSNITIGSNGTLTGGGGGQVTIGGLGYSGDLNATNGAPTGTYVAGTLAQTVVSNASNAKIAADQATIDVATKLNKSSADTLSAVLSVSTTTVAGLRVGDLVWNSSGVRQSGSGVAITPAGLVGYSGATNTFSISTSGDAYFAGTLSVTGTTAGQGSMTITNNNIVIRDSANTIRVKLGSL